MAVTSDERYYSYGRFLRERFAGRVYKVGVDAGFTCPNIDGRVAVGGCTFCNNDSFRPAALRLAGSVGEQITQETGFLRSRFGADQFMAYFQAYTNTYAPVAQLRRLYREALDQPDVVALSIATRPDCVNPEILAMIDELAADRTVIVEYGVQSIHDSTLDRINRGHHYDAFLRALDWSANRRFLVGAHIILGFPWETRQQMLATAGELSRRSIHLLKIHHLQVVRGTALARQHRTAPFELLDCQAYIDLLGEFLARLRPDIAVERLFGTAPPRMLLAPRWNKTKTQLLGEIHRHLEQAGIVQGMQWNSLPIPSHERKRVGDQ